MKSRLCWAVICGVALGIHASAHAEIQVGAAVRVITPEKMLPVSGGLGIPKATTEKRGELTARAIVFRKGDVSVGVVSLDVLGFPSVLGDRVCAKVKGISKENILIASTHTHSAPDCYAFPDGKGGHTGDLAYMDFVCDRTAEALNAAIEQLQPASLKIATGEAQGKIAYNYYAPDLYDRRMSVIQAVNSQGKTIATLVNYAVHPEVLGNSVGILSPDLVGPLCDKLEAKAGGIGIFVNGAQGGMITADNRNLNDPKDPLRGYWSDSRTWDECLRIGHLMADEALRIVHDAPEQRDPTLTCHPMNVRFPVESTVLWLVVVGSPLKYPHNPDQSVTARINLVNLGNAQILTIPGEALPNIGFYLKRKMRGQHNLLFGLTNDAFGYILTKVDFRSFPRYDYVSRTSLGEMTGEILIESALELVEQSPRPDGAKRDVSSVAKPLPRAHAHNDYEHARPLLDALDHGFCSVEADIYLTPDGLLVAHDRKDLKPGRTLQALYLDPLRARIQANGGRVYRDFPTFSLLMDVKTDAFETYALLDGLLAGYEDILSVTRNGKFTPGAVTIVLSGNRAMDVVSQQTVRFVGIDGRPDDLNSSVPVHQMPWISSSWASQFQWRGDGPMPAVERQKLGDIVRQAHEHGRKVRFWATPESTDVWKELLAADVDFINTDRLDELQQFLSTAAQP